MRKLAHVVECAGVLTVFLSLGLARAQELSAEGGTSAEDAGAIVVVDPSSTPTADGGTPTADGGTSAEDAGPIVVDPSSTPSVDGGGAPGTEKSDGGRAEQPAEVDFADPAVPLERKRAVLVGLSGPTLDRALAQVEPSSARATLCGEARERVGTTSVRVESADANGELVVARVLVDGVDVGEGQLEARVALCAQTLELMRGDERRAIPLHLTRERSVVHVDWGGTARLWSLAPVVDLTTFDPPTQLVPAGKPTAVAVIGTGLRLDRWSTLFHGSLAVTANPLYGPLFNLPVLPNIDLFAGLHFRPGGRSVRALLSAQLGLWQLVHPAARATIGMMLFDRIFVSVSGDARMMLAPLLFPSFARYFPSLVAFGASGAAGVSW